MQDGVLAPIKNGFHFMSLMPVNQLQNNGFDSFCVFEHNSAREDGCKHAASCDEPEIEDLIE